MNQNKTVHAKQSVRSFQLIGLILLLLSLVLIQAAKPRDVQPVLAAEKATGADYAVYLPIILKDGVPGSNFKFYALSDANVVPSGSALDALLTAQKPYLCNQLKPPVTVMSYQGARTAAWSYLEQRVGASNLATIRTLPEVATAEKAQMLAMAAMMDGRPDGALTGLLIAYEKAPNNPMILVNTAGVLNSLGMPNHALAFLDQATIAPGELANTMNVPGEQVAANNRAHTHMSLGQWAEAEALLRPIVAAGTELSEARQNLSIALLCQHKDEEAAHFYRLGARRQVVDEAEEINGRLPLDRIYDLSAGEEPTLPAPTVPAGTSQHPDTATHYQGVVVEVLSHGNDIVAQEDDLIIQIDTRFPDLPTLTTIRFVNVISAITSADQEPDILALETDFAAAEEDLAEMLERHGNEYLDLVGQELEPVVFFSACGTLLTNQWAEQLGALQAYTNARRTHAEALYEAQTGLAANLIDPLHHSYASLLAEEDANNAQFEIMNKTAVITGDMAALWEYCEGFRNDAFPPPAEPAFPRSAECPPFVRGVEFSLNFADLVGLTVNCEKEELELSAGAPGAILGYFSQITYNPRNESVTLFAGAKQKLTGLGLVSLSAKEGLYIRATPDGQIADVGVKVSTSGGVGGGALSGSADGPGVELSFVSAVNYLTN